MAHAAFAKSRKISFAVTLFLGGAFFSFSQNGIPLDVLQNDPYFRNGTYEAQQTDSAEAKNDSRTDDVANEQPENTTATESDSAESDSTQNNQEQFHGYDTVSIPQPLTADDLQTKDPIVDAKIDISLSYLIFYTYPFQSGGVADYLVPDDFFHIKNLNPYGAALKAEFMILPSLFGVNGFGFNATWTPLKCEAGTYVVETNLCMANLMLVHKIRLPKTRTLLEVHLGCGGMFFLFPTYTYATGYSPQSYLWVYPEATAGFAVQVYFTRHLGIDISLDASYPFFIEVIFPVAQLTAGLECHF